MGKKYSVGDKVVTADNWNNGMGRIIPKGSVVEIIRDFEYGGINMYDCEYNGGRCIYEEQWLGDKYVNPKIGGWIPCSERLPEESLCSVIGWDEYRKRCCFVQYLGGRWILGNDIESVKITHWQPVPTAPYEVKSDE